MGQIFYTYVLYSKKFNKIYFGYTSNLEGRLEAHNHPKSKGWTKKYQPWVRPNLEEDNYFVYN